MKIMGRGHRRTDSKAMPQFFKQNDKKMHRQIWNWDVADRIATGYRMGYSEVGV
jgi:hypothetical protein